MLTSRATIGESGQGLLTLGVQHLLDGTTDASRLSQDHKLKAIAGDEGHVLAQALVLG